MKPPEPDRVRRALEPASARDLLKRITFRLDMSSPGGWKAWLAGKGKLGQKAWMRLAVERLLRLIAKDPEAGRAFFEKAVYEWNDPASSSTFPASSSTGCCTTSSWAGST